VKTAVASWRERGQRGRRPPLEGRRSSSMGRRSSRAVLSLATTVDERYVTSTSYMTFLISCKLKTSCRRHSYLRTISLRHDLKKNGRAIGLAVCPRMEKGSGLITAPTLSYPILSYPPRNGAERSGAERSGAEKRITYVLRRPPAPKAMSAPPRSIRCDKRERERERVALLGWLVRSAFSTTS
jgi:hypothetical protein